MARFVRDNGKGDEFHAFNIVGHEVRDANTGRVITDGPNEYRDVVLPADKLKNVELGDHLIIEEKSGAVSILKKDEFPADAIPVGTEPKEETENPPVPEKTEGDGAKTDDQGAETSTETPTLTPTSNPVDGSVDDGGETKTDADEPVDGAVDGDKAEGQ